MAKFKISELNNKHFLALTGNGVIAAIAFGLIALLTRSLTKADVGIWFYFSMICALGDAARNGFLSTATIKFYSGTSRERGQEVLGSVWFMAIITTLLLVLISIAFLPFIHSINNEGAVVSIKWFGATFISSMPFTLIFWILVAEEKYGKILWLRMVNNGSMIIYVIILILIHKMTIQALLCCNFLTNCLTSIVGLLWGLGRVQTIFHRSRQCMMDIFHFGKYSLGSNFVSRLLGSTDTFIITAMLGLDMLAVYSVALKLMEVVELILRTFIGTGLSGMAIAYNNNNLQQTGYIMKKYSGMLTIAFVPLCLLVLIFADSAIYILAGHKYMGTEAANILRIFMAVALLYPLDRFIGATLDIIHKPNINLYKVIIMLLFAIGGDYAGIIIFKNLYGVAFASVFTVLSGLIFGYIYLNKYIKVPLTDILSLGYGEMKIFVRQKLLRKGI